MSAALPTGYRTVALALLLGLAGAANARADSYTRCAAPAGTTLVRAARTSCAAVQAAARAVAAAPADTAAAALQGTGWTPYRALAADVPGGPEFDLVGLRGKAVVLVRRPGLAPDLDGFSAGRELVFARGRIVGGQQIPDGSAFCTSAFTLRLAGGSLEGLSAAHCAGLHSNGTTARGNVAERRPPAPGIVLGRVQRYLPRSLPLDALLLPVPQGAARTATAVVDRGIAKPPWIVAGVATPTGGRRMCFAGRTSGPDRCGRLRGSAARPLERYLQREGGTVVRCSTSVAAEGDSGGPVYTRPRKDGTVYALGITTLIVGPRNQMCFTPLGPILRGLRATLVTGG
jgi:hypothetical protein